MQWYNLETRRRSHDRMSFTDTPGAQREAMKAELDSMTVALPLRSDRPWSRRCHTFPLNTLSSRGLCSATDSSKNNGSAHTGLLRLFSAPLVH